MVKVGSLFDGSGGFPLAGSLCDFEPVWASEVEPYPIAVTKSRFPKMKHLGDISKINGTEIEPVDVITFGSPCQDLSVAGKRAGLKHENNGDEETTRSGLFMEAIRIIKEMRDVTSGEYPRFAVWENVPGAFSSNKGEDFRIVLEEFVKICEPAAVMPDVPKAGWAYADSYSGNGWSLAYRVLDAQYWGVPQRRRRIYLVADFRGKCAGKILFERKGLRGYSAESRTQGETVAGDVESGVRAASGASCVALSGNDQYLFQPVTEQYLFENHSQDTRYKGPLSVCPMLPAQLGTGGNNTPFVVEKSSVVYNGENITSPVNATNPQPGDPCHTLGTDSRNCLVYCLQGNGIDRADTAGCNGKGWNDKNCYTLNTIDRPAVVYAVDQGGGKSACNVSENQSPTLTCTHGGEPAVAYQKQETVYYIVRRLTPTECARLQGFPDRWGDIDRKEDFTEEEYRFWLEVRNTHAAINSKQVKDHTKAQMLTWYNKLHTDSSEYKMWGNGIALPCALYVMQGIQDILEGK